MRTGSKPMKIHQLSVQDALGSLRSAVSGLSAAEAARRLREHGANVVQEVTRAPVWLRFVSEFVQFFSLILWAAAGLAFLAEWSDPGQGMARIGYAIVIVILVSGLFSFWQEYRNEQTLAALARLLPQQVKVLRADTLRSIPIFSEPGEPRARTGPSSSMCSSRPAVFRARSRSSQSASRRTRAARSTALAAI